MSKKNQQPVVKSCTSHEIIGHIRKAWYDGQSVVPLIGAGFSADSGFPILQSISRYLARFKIAMENELLLPTFAKDESKFRENLLYSKSAQDHPLSIIESIGWPDRFWLNQTVATLLSKDWDRKQSRHNHIEQQITARFSWLAEVSSTTRVSNAWKSFVKGLNINDETYAWERWAMQGDWRRLIQYFTNYSSDLADDLFAQYGFFRNPSAGHRYLAQLVQLLSIQKIFTFNFDDLIEKSLRQENMQFRVFGMEHGSSLPSLGVVAEMLAIIKMHGSHHSILVDERLDKPLSDEYKQKFNTLVGKRCVLLVMGCSGDDRRLSDLLQSQEGDVTVCWLHFEPNAPVFHGLNCNFYSATTNSPGAFVRHLLYSLSSRFPESASPYISHPRLPIPQNKSTIEQLSTFLASPESIDQDRPNLRVSSSEQLLELCGACVNKGFIPIWVDLEAVRTLAGIVGVIIDGCRRVDPELPASVMIGDLRDQASKRYAIERLAFALQRQRYAVLIDGLSTFQSDLLQHHGQRALFDEQSEAPSDIELLNEFLIQLNDACIGQSILFASKVGHAKRRSEESQNPGELIESPDSNLKGHALLWVCMATIRRTRPLPMLRRLIAPMIPKSLSPDMEDFLQEIAGQSSSPIRILEGGDVWFLRQKRDNCYSIATRFTGRTVFQQCKTQPRDEKTRQLRACALAQSFLMVMIHRKIASTYFSFEFMQSRDAASFLEYTYHRISSLRNLARCIYLCNEYPDSFFDAKEKLEAIKRDIETTCADFFHSYFGQIWREWESQENAGQQGQDLRKHLGKDLHALLAAWREFEQTVRSQIPAEQLIHWIVEIADSKVIDRIQGVYVGNTHVENKDESTAISRLVEELKSYFRDLHARVSLERGDAIGAKKILTSDKIDDSQGSSIDSVGGRKRVLDIIECLVRSGDFSSAETKLKLFESKFDRVVNEQSTAGNQGVLRIDESKHRLYHLSVLVHLRGNSWLEYGIINGKLSVGQGSDEPIEWKKALECTEEGIEHIRGPGSLLARSLDGMVVSFGSLGGAYRPYRSVFRTLKGRALIAKLLVEPRQPPSLDEDLGLFQRSMRQFDEAKGGLESSHAILRGWADLHATEGTLMFIRRIYDMYGSENIGLIEAKLQSAKSHLLQAVSAIRAARRNAVWWRQYYQIVAQYHTERSLYNLCVQSKSISRNMGCSLLDDDRKDMLHQLAVDVLRRYRRGLDSTASYLDNSLIRSDALSSRWFRRNIHELILSTALAITRFDQSCEISFESFTESARLIYDNASSEYPRASLRSDSMRHIREAALNSLMRSFDQWRPVEPDQNDTRSIFLARELVVNAVRTACNGVHDLSSII